MSRSRNYCASTTGREIFPLVGLLYGEPYSVGSLTVPLGSNDILPLLFSKWSGFTTPDPGDFLYFIHLEQKHREAPSKPIQVTLESITTS